MLMKAVEANSWKKHYNQRESERFRDEDKKNKNIAKCKQKNAWHKYREQKKYINT